MQRRSNAERIATTRGALLASARDLFGRDGFEATGTNAILDRAGLTRGALYHHFKDKRALFLGVVRSLEAEIAESVGAAIAALPDPFARLRAAVLAYLDRVGR